MPPYRDVQGVPILGSTLTTTPDVFWSFCFLFSFFIVSFERCANVVYLYVPIDGWWLKAIDGWNICEQTTKLRKHKGLYRLMLPCWEGVICCWEKEGLKWTCSILPTASKNNAVAYSSSEGHCAVDWRSTTNKQLIDNLVSLVHIAYIHMLIQHRELDQCQEFVCCVNTKKSSSTGTGDGHFNTEQAWDTFAFQ